jgi:hypothetical protein
MRSLGVLLLAGCAIAPPTCADLSADVGVSYSTSTGAMAGNETSVWIVVPIDATAVNCVRGK